MSQVNGLRDGAPDPSARAEELFRWHQQDIFRKTDDLFARLMVVQWLVGIVAALLIAPRT